MGFLVDAAISFRDSPVVLEAEAIRSPQLADSGSPQPRRGGNLIDSVGILEPLTGIARL
jgi:hypothetical protein